MSCRHESASVHRSMIVDRDGERWLRSFCPDCRHFVDTRPKIMRDGSVRASAWVPTDFAISENEIDPKESTTHV